MDPWLENLANWLPAGMWYYIWIGCIAFLESLAIVGIFVPGSVVIVLAGFFAAQGKGDALSLMAVSALGAVLGDMLSYLLGARFGEILFHTRILKRRRKVLERARSFFLGHGGKAVFFGRFVGFLRPFMPMIAGSARMSPALFAIYALISGILWGIAYPGLGYFFGASWQQVQIWTGRLSLLILVLAGLLILNHLFWRYLFPGLLRVVGRLWQSGKAHLETLADSDWSRGLAARLPVLHAFALDRLSLRKSTGFALTLGFLVSFVFALTFFWISRAILRQTPLARANQIVYDLMPSLHHPASDLLFGALSELASLPALLLVAAFVLVWLMLNNRDFSSLALLLGIPAGQALLLLIKFMFEQARPQPYFAHLEPSFAAFPSGHAFSAVVLYGLIAYFLLGRVRVWENRFYLTFWASFLALLIGFSRLYLGAHWLSDVLGGLALGGFWLSVLITLCEMRFRYGAFPLRRGWQPFHLSARARLWVLIPFGLLTALSIGLIIVTELELLTRIKSAWP